MGTKLQHTIDPLATNSFCQLNDWDYFREKEKRPSRLFKFEDPVNTMLEQLHIESIKKTMLMHEDIFKQQLRELHRLYRVQRMLMDDLNNDTKQSRQRGRKICLDMNHSSFVRQDDIPTAEYNIHIQSIRDVNLISAPECTASCSTEALRIPKQFDLQRPAEENISTGVSANEEDQIWPITNMPLIETNAKAIDDGSDEGSNGTEVELTLSIGPSTVMRRSNSYKNHCSLQIGSSSGLIKIEDRKECTEADANMASSGTVFNQESKRQHWLFQDLSLNRT